MIGPHYYDGLDKDPLYAVKVELTMRDLAEKVNKANCGAHRFLLHLIDVRRKEKEQRIQTYRDRGDHDVADYATRAGDPLMDAIEELLKQGLT